jgi:hypothetical protein
MSDLLQHVELVKLAHDLQVEVSEVEFLRPLSEAQLRALRAAVNHALFAPYEPRFARMAGMSRHVPAPLAAKGAQIALGALVAARVAAVTATHHAVRLTDHLSTAFLAEMTPHIDPAKVADIVVALPESTVTAVGHELVRRQEYIPLGRFVSYVPVETALRVIDDAPPADLLQVAIFTEDRAALDEVIAAVPDRTLVDVLNAADAAGRIDDALTLLSALAVESRTRVVGLVATLEDHLRDSLIRAVSRNHAWPDLTPALAHLDRNDLLRLLDVPALDDPDVMADLEHVTTTPAVQDLLDELRTRRT